MKVNDITSNKPPEFHPIELVVTIESQAELDSLIARLSISNSTINTILSTRNYSVKERAVDDVTDILLQKLELLSK